MNSVFPIVTNEGTKEIIEKHMSINSWVWYTKDVGTTWEIGEVTGYDDSGVTIDSETYTYESTLPFHYVDPKYSTPDKGEHSFVFKVTHLRS
tara:strand:- start:117 stop:392 length:276 start_codon:yes stop_codon:yes gene_type:complete